MAHWSLGNTSNSSTMGKHPQAALMIVDPHILMEHHQNTPIANADEHTIDGEFWCSKHTRCTLV
jgi:hypothetical protein